MRNADGHELHASSQATDAVGTASEIYRSNKRVVCHGETLCCAVEQILSCATARTWLAWVIVGKGEHVDRKRCASYACDGDTSTKKIGTILLHTMGGQFTVCSMYMEVFL